MRANIIKNLRKELKDMIEDKDLKNGAFNDVLKLDGIIKQLNENKISLEEVGVSKEVLKVLLGEVYGYRRFMRFSLLC